MVNIGCYLFVKWVDQILSIEFIPTLCRFYVITLYTLTFVVLASMASDQFSTV